MFSSSASPQASLPQDGEHYQEPGGYHHHHHHHYQPHSPGLDVLKPYAAPITIVVVIVLLLAAAV